MSSLLRTALLAGSRSQWLRERATRFRFVQRSVSRFMPGERLEDALIAAGQLNAIGVPSLLTRLGENVTEASDADIVAGHYLGVLDRIEAVGLPAQISVKLTQLGLDIGVESCCRRLKALVERASASGNFVWIDMEDSSYVDTTLDLYRCVRANHAKVGVCLQSYLYRTSDDLDRLLPLGPAIRLVKGAYQEPEAVALQRKHEVDENFFMLACRILDHEPIAGTFVAVATHDGKLVDRIRSRIGACAYRRDGYEFEMLYGINRGLQDRLSRAHEPLRVLISYGEHWFPWYMRRLAERPANVLFVAKNLFA
jgi:proline dehydrogenase